MIKKIIRYIIPFYAIELKTNTLIKDIVELFSLSSKKEGFNFKKADDEYFIGKINLSGFKLIAVKKRKEFLNPTLQFGFFVPIVLGRFGSKNKFTLIDLKFRLSLPVIFFLFMFFIVDFYVLVETSVLFFNGKKDAIYVGILFMVTYLITYLIMLIVFWKRVRELVNVFRIIIE